ncbi:uncharacterized protein [Henckelia pumila]|uniref:uncharacterized protein n=1 Tax=Henckelia pumila TaxID=405737 RepID=UPI003C6DCDFA
MLAGITRLLDSHAGHPKKSHEEDVAERFQKQGPNEFWGTTDPLVAREWIFSLETIYVYMGLQDTDNVCCAIYMLKEDAALWWEGAVIGLDLTALTWENFKNTFFEKYFTEDVHSQLVRDFMSLRQGDKSVVEFEKWFERGCHFVPMIAKDEKEKLRHFTDGLRYDIKNDVYMEVVMTYKAEVNRAFWLEKG